jgi:hypothetical protein
MVKRKRKRKAVSGRDGERVLLMTLWIKRDFLLIYYRWDDGFYAVLYASVRGTQTPRRLTDSKVLKVLTDDLDHVFPRRTTSNRHGVSIPERAVAGRGVAARP